MKTILLSQRLINALLLLLVILCGNKSFAAFKVSGIAVSSQSATLTYGTASSTTYTLTLSETGNGIGSSVLSINWTAAPGTTVTGLGTTTLTGNGQTVTFTITTIGTTPAGTTAFTISSTVNVITSSSANFIVSKRGLTITANNANKMYGTTQATPVTGATAFVANGLANNETVSSVTLTYGSGALTAAANVGVTSTITPSAASGGTFLVANYTLTYANGTLTVIAATPTVTVTVGTYTYNTSPQGPTVATNTGTGNSYTFSYSGTGNTTYGPSATRPTIVGTYTVTVTVAANGNYTLATSNAAAFAIGTMTPTVTPTIGTYTYIAAAQGPASATNTGTGSSYTFSYSGMGNTSYGPSSTQPTSAGTYTVTASVAANGNYGSASSSAIAFSIQQAALTITAINVTKDYGITYTLGNTAFTSSGLKGGEVIGGVTLTSAGTTAAAATGNYSIVPANATGGTFSLANYTLTYVNGTLTVTVGSIGGSLSGASAICAGTAGGALTLTGHTGSVLRWESSVSPFTLWTTIANTTATYTSGTLTETTRFRAVIQSGSSPIAYSTTAETTVGGTTTWNGTVWSNGFPDAIKGAVLAGNYTSNGTNINACSLTINNNATVLFSAGDSVNLSGAITVANGSSVTFESNANLIQHGTANTNSGNVIIKRESADIQRLDYTLWASPVAGQQLQAFSPQTANNRFYTYNAGTNQYDMIASPATVNFEMAKGYLIRVANNHPTTAQPWLGSFTGIPNSGNYTYTLQNLGNGSRFNLIGNPYPSPIAIDAFINNTNNAATITGTLYFWRKTNGSNMASYCTLTPLGGFVSNGSAAANAFAQSPTVVIQPGQGFFVEATGMGSGNVQFDNTMRTDDHQNHFLKNNNATAAVEKHRIWLNATNTAGYFSQTMIGYIANATQEADTYIDGKYINDGDIALASLIGTTPYAIQGRALPFDPADVVPLSFKATTAGDYTIAIDHVDGLFSDSSQPIFLRDNLNGTVHDLHTGAYTFASESGTFTSRFELIYQQQLGISNPVFNANQVVIYRDQTNNLVISSGNEVMADVKVFDINGKLLLEKRDINASQTAMTISLTNEVVLVQITAENGIVVTKKYLLQRMALKKDKNVLVNSQIANDE